MIVRPLVEDDRDAWEPLWRAYLEFYEHELPDVVTGDVFARLAEQADDMFGLVAEDDDGAVVGFAHVITHPSTWTVDRYVYLEDLFVDPAARRRGVARALIEAVFDRAGDRKVYWQTARDNPARALYDQVAAHRGYVVYER